MNIKEEKWLFYNDLQEYKNSIEGKRLASAFKNNNTENLENLIIEYYTKRNSNKLTYYKQKDLISGKETDKYISNLYKEID